MGPGEKAAAASRRHGGAPLIRFGHFAAIDWSGAVGERQRGIAVALCEAGDHAPTLVRPDHIWSRQDVLDWLLAELPPSTLVGLDLGMSLPFADFDVFFPGWVESPGDARGLWELVDRIAANDPHLAATSFVDHPDAARHFRRHGGRCGDLFQSGGGRLRVTEHKQREQGLNPYSNLNLIGAAQVGKSSLTGMRLLQRIGDSLPIWPFDSLPESGSVLVEIYTALAAVSAGRPKGRSKIRDAAMLDLALDRLGSHAHGSLARHDDHATDAILTAAWLRMAAFDRALWHPAAMTPAIAQTEGWTFGVR